MPFGPHFPAGQLRMPVQFMAQRYGAFKIVFIRTIFLLAVLWAPGRCSTLQKIDKDYFILYQEFVII
jgi:hypothetical protein